MMARRAWRTPVALSVFLVPACAWCQGAGLRAGVARVDITPSQPCMLSGYASRTNLSTGVHDPLSARAVAFEHGGHRVVLVSSDIIGFYGDMAEHMRARITAACGLRPDELVLTAIHTHAAPTLTLEEGKLHPNNLEYTKVLRERLIAACQAAITNLRPARIRFGSGASPVGVNRREPYLDKAGNTQIRLGRNPAIPIDTEVQVLEIREVAGDRMTSALFAYATHSTSLGAKNLVVSGDVHGLAEQFVERHLGSGVIAAAFAGASGNVDPWFRVLPGIKTENDWMPEPVLLGTMLGEEVVHTLGRTHDLGGDGPVASLIKTVELPAKTEPEKPPGAPTVPLTISVARVGDVAIVGLGAEVFNEIGRAIKDRSPFPHTMVVTHCNGGAGYLVLREAYAQGGYEVKTSPFAPEAAERVLRDIDGMLAQLKE